jgi:hypothetical protein
MATWPEHKPICRTPTADASPSVWPPRLRVRATTRPVASRSWLPNTSVSCRKRPPGLIRRVTVLPDRGQKTAWVDRLLGWLGVGVVTAGMSAAMIAGAGVASADTGSSSKWRQRDIRLNQRRKTTESKENSKTTTSPP